MIGFIVVLVIMVSLYPLNRVMLTYITSTGVWTLQHRSLTILLSVFMFPCIILAGLCMITYIENNSDKTVRW